MYTRGDLRPMSEMVNQETTALWGLLPVLCYGRLEYTVTLSLIPHSYSNSFIFLSFVRCFERFMKYASINSLAVTFSKSIARAHLDFSSQHEGCIVIVHWSDSPAAIHLYYFTLSIGPRARSINSLIYVLQSWIQAQSLFLWCIRYVLLYCYYISRGSIF
jgi:hypothetical protein